MWRLATWHHHLPHNAVPIDRNGGPLLTLAAEQRAICSYDRAVADGGKRAVAHLTAAIRANPFAGEPRIVRALFRLESGKTATAYADAVRGYELLRAWSVAWDRRKLSRTGWSLRSASSWTWVRRGAMQSAAGLSAAVCGPSAC